MITNDFNILDFTNNYDEIYQKHHKIKYTDLWVFDVRTFPYFEIDLSNYGITDLGLINIYLVNKDDETIKYNFKELITSGTLLLINKRLIFKSGAGDVLNESLSGCYYLEINVSNKETLYSNYMHFKELGFSYVPSTFIGFNSYYLGGIATNITIKCSQDTELTLTVDDEITISEIVGVSGYTFEITPLLGRKNTRIAGRCDLITYISIEDEESRSHHESVTSIETIKDAYNLETFEYVNNVVGQAISQLELSELNEFEYLTKLKRLKLRHLGISNLTNLSYDTLEELVLISCQSIDLINRCNIRDYANLTILNINRCYIDSSKFRNLIDAPNMTYVDLTDNALYKLNFIGSKNTGANPTQNITYYSQQNNSIYGDAGIDAYPQDYVNLFANNGIEYYDLSRNSLSEYAIERIFYFISLGRSAREVSYELPVPNLTINVSGRDSRGRQNAILTHRIIFPEIIDGGTGYSVNDILQCSVGDAEFIVTSVDDVTGAITEVDINNAGAGYKDFYAQNSDGNADIRGYSAYYLITQDPKVTIIMNE